MLKTISATCVLVTILNLFACSEERKKQEAGLPNEVKEQLAKSVDSFNNRPIYEVLTVNVIDSTLDQDLLQVVFDNLSAKLPADYEKEYSAVMSWNKSRQAIYMIWIWEAEVNNGGHNQFYYNPGGEYYKHLPDCLKLIGADLFADIMINANNTFEKENPKITQHQDGTLEGFSESYEDNPLNRFDMEFYELNKTETLRQLQVAYIRKHKTDFIDR